MLRIFIFTSILFFLMPGFAQKNTFKIVPLGVKGGSNESNLSAYMLAPASSDDYVCLDAGTLHTGIEKAIKSGTFKVSPETVLRQNIKGYLISHGHLDHLAGLILNAPDDTAKNIYALPYVIDILKDKYFSWAAWANFADQGEQPLLNKYHYAALDSSKEIELEHTSMYVRAFPLSHVNPYESTAFLVRSNKDYILYLGDTGADEEEQSGRLHALWQFVAPLVKNKKLKAIFIETSFPNEQPGKLLFGHLTPKLLMKEMNVLAAMAGVSTMLQFPVVVTHMKPAGNHETTIKKQLAAANNLSLKLIYPVQGKMIRF